MVKNLKELLQKFSDDNACRQLLVQMRWDGCPECPYCGSDKYYIIEGGKRFKCGNKLCYKKYSVTVGTVFEASNIPLSTWFPAMYLIASHKKGISSIQLAKDLQVTQKTAWFMLHRIRESLKDKKSVILGNTVEIDEVYIGGRVKNKHKSYRMKLKAEGKIASHLNNKVGVMGLIERDGSLKFEIIDSNKGTLKDIVRAYVHPSASVITDSLISYVGLNNEYESHEVIKHDLDEYVRGNVHTNTIEGAFSHLKRMIYGIYHHVSPKHLSRYCDESSYRYNTRKMKDGDRFTTTLSRLEGRLSYKGLTEPGNKVQMPTTFPMIEKKHGNKKSILQLKDGIVVGKYSTIVEASLYTLISRISIRRVLIGRYKSTGGYEWKYAD